MNGVELVQPAAQGGPVGLGGHRLAESAVGRGRQASSAERFESFDYVLIQVESDASLLHKNIITSARRPTISGVSTSEA
jgi:hypothetical protein